MSRAHLAILGLLCLVVAVVCPAQQAPTFTYYPLPNHSDTGYPALPQRIVAGPDGNLWVTQAQWVWGMNLIFRLTPGGVLTEHVAPAGTAITVGADGNLWYINAFVRNVARYNPMTPDVWPTEFPLPGGYGDYGFSDIISGPDGKLWTTAQFASGTRFVRVTTGGIVDGNYLAGVIGINSPGRLAVGSDGNVWVGTQAYVSQGAKITPDGVVTVIADGPAPGFAAGPDDRFWYGSGYYSFSAMTAGGAISSYSFGEGTPGGPITTGPDGNLWASASSNVLGWGVLRINTTGQYRFFAFGTPYDRHSSSDIITGPDGCLWLPINPSNEPGLVSYVVRACLPGPRLTSLSSTDPDGVYLTGASLNLTVTFDNTVVVTGTPRLTLNSGGVATYNSGSGTNTLTFTYTVGAGDQATRLDAAPAAPLRDANLGRPVMAFHLNGGTIRDASGNDAILIATLAPAAGALGTNKHFGVNLSDPTAPTTIAVPSPAPNAAGWNNSDVTVTLNATDLDGSGVKQIQYSLSGAQNQAEQTVSGSTASFTVSAEGATVVTYFATDNMDNVEAAKTLTIQLDKTAPTLTFSAAEPAPNAAGWHRTDVLFAFTANDSLSGLASTSVMSPLILSAEGTAVSDSVIATDLAGNSATFTSPGVKIDKTTPTVTGTRSPSPNANGWNNTPVSVTFLCEDGLSGLAPGSPPAAIILSSDGAGQSAGGTCQDQAGNAVSLTMEEINIDQTPPVAAAAAAPPANANGWNNTNVTVSFTGTDGGSGIDSCSAAVVLSTEGSGQSAAGTCTDKAGNVSPPATKTGVNIDKTSPDLAFEAASPAPNVNGWNNSDVTVPFSASDALSGLESTTPPASPLVLSAEGAAVSGTVTVTDKAGNTAAFASPAFKIDKTQPLLTRSRAPAPNANGWNNTPVTVTFPCTDGLSGLAPGSPPADIVLSSEGADQSAPGSCLDQAGNTASVTVDEINIDWTPPVAAAAADPPANANGWNNSKVTVSFTGTDSGSGIESCSPAVVLNTEGTGQSATGTCTDKAGNESAPASKTGINIDKTSPELAFGAASPAPNVNGWNNSDVTVPFTASDALSGLESTTPVSPLVLSAEGRRLTGTVAATDKAGNTATFTSPVFKIDKTPPLLAGSQVPAPNASGWNNSDVTVAFACSDPVAGVASLIPGPFFVVSSEGANQSVPGVCQDAAGNTAAVTVAPINIDKTKPVVTDVEVDNVPINVVSLLKATVTDSSSGLASVEYSLDNSPYTAMVRMDGQWTASLGPWAAAGVHAVCVHGADRASNAAAISCEQFAVYDPVAPFPESAHPYSNNFDFTWTYTLGTAVKAGTAKTATVDWLSVTFDPRTSVETSNDWLYVMDGNGQNIPGSPFTGKALAGQTVNVPGATVKIRLSTNARSDDWGFKVISIVPGGLVTPDLSISKSHTGNFAIGQVGAQYSMVVQNVGTAPTSGPVTVSDTLPAGLTAAAIGGTGWTCTQPGGPCTRSDVLNAGSAYPPITLTVNVTAQSPATVTNSAGVSGGGETNTANNTALDPTNIVWQQSPNLVIAKSHPGSFVRGQTGAYTIVVSNTGTAPSSGTVTVTETLPGGLTAVSISGTGWNCGHPAGPCTRNDALAPGASYPPITLTVNVSAGAPAQVVNRASLSGGGFADDPTTIVDAPQGCTIESPHPYPNDYDQTWTCTLPRFTSLNVTFDPQTSVEPSDWIYVMDGNGVGIPGSPFTGSALAGQTKVVSGPTVKVRLLTDGRKDGWGLKVTSVTGSGTSGPDLAMSKSHVGNFTRGQTGATYTLTVRNVGTGPTAGQVSVTDTVPAGLTATGIGGAGWSCTQPAGPCTRSDVLAAGATYPAITLTVNVAADAPNSVSNSATVTGGGDSSTGNNTAVDPATIGGGGTACDLESPHPYPENLDQTWTCTVAGNPGSIEVTFDARTMIESSGDWLYVMDGNGVNIPGSPFTGNTLAGQTKTVPGATVRLRLVSDGRRSEWGFKVTSATAAGPPAPDLTITKTHTGNFEQGQIAATYTITVRNVGGVATSGTVSVTDTVPAGLTAATIGGTGWTCVQAAGPCTRDDALAPGASYPPITLTVNVAANAPASVTNTATVSGGGDASPANNQAFDLTVVTGPQPPCVLPESTHPYPNEFDFTWTCTYPGNLSGLQVTFDPQTSVEFGNDWIYVTDGNGVNIAGSPFTGTTLAGQTKLVPGATVRIRLVTDRRTEDWGFKVTNIVAAPALPPTVL